MYVLQRRGRRAACANPRATGSQCTHCSGQCHVPVCDSVQQHAAVRDLQQGGCSVALLQALPEQLQVVLVQWPCQVAQSSSALASLQQPGSPGVQQQLCRGELLGLPLVRARHLLQLTLPVSRQGLCV